MLKRVLKRSAQTAVAAIAPHLWRHRSNMLLVLMYHRILSRDDPRREIEQPGMVVCADTFRLHLAVLKRHFQIVKLKDWTDAVTTGAPIPPRACAITFDDGWRDNFENAYPALREAGVPATIFLVSDVVGTNKTFWPERLGMALLRGLRDYGDDLFSVSAFAWLSELGDVKTSLEATVIRDSIDRIISAAKRYPDALLEDRLDDMERQLPTQRLHSPSLLSWDQAREMVKSGLVDIGSHTRRHVLLTEAITDDMLEDEIVGSRKKIEREIGNPVDLFCYPNGDASAKALSIVRKAYTAACTTVRGWHAVEDDPHRIKRIGVHEDIARDELSFKARMSGWL